MMQKHRSEANTVQEKELRLITDKHESDIEVEPNVEPEKNDEMQDKPDVSDSNERKAKPNNPGEPDLVLKAF